MGIFLSARLHNVKKVFVFTFMLSFFLQQFCFAAGISPAEVGAILSRGLGAQSALSSFSPAMLRFLSINLDDPAQPFDFLLDKGDSRLSKLTISQEASKLVTYFKIGIALPNDSFWVNLNPSQPDSIIPAELAQTEIGNVFLAADLQLKKDVARIMHPDHPVGKIYWNRLFAELGTNTSITTDNRVWIVPDTAQVYQMDESVLITEAKLKVMLENEHAKRNPQDKQQQVAEKLMRELIIPELTKDINTMKSYANLRQVYYALILAQWFKKQFVNTRVPFANAIDKGLTNDLIVNTSVKQVVWNEYKASLAKGEYKRADSASATAISYFSGGMDMGPIAISQAVSLPNGVVRNAAIVEWTNGKEIISSPSKLFQPEDVSLSTATDDNQKSDENAQDQDTSKDKGFWGLVKDAMVGTMAGPLAIFEKAFVQHQPTPVRQPDGTGVRRAYYANEVYQLYSYYDKHELHGRLLVREDAADKGELGSLKIVVKDDETGESITVCDVAPGSEAEQAILNAEREAQKIGWPESRLRIATFVDFVENQNSSGTSESSSPMNELAPQDTPAQIAENLKNLRENFQGEDVNEIVYQVAEWMSERLSVLELSEVSPEQFFFLAHQAIIRAGITIKSLEIKYSYKGLGVARAARFEFIPWLADNTCSPKFAEKVRAIAEEFKNIPSTEKNPASSPATPEEEARVIAEQESLFTDPNQHWGVRQKNLVAIMNIAGKKNPKSNRVILARDVLIRRLPDLADIVKREHGIFVEIARDAAAVLAKVGAEKTLLNFAVQQDWKGSGTLRAAGKWRQEAYEFLWGSCTMEQLVALSNDHTLGDEERKMAKEALYTRFLNDYGLKPRSAIYEYRPKSSSPIEDESDPKLKEIAEKVRNREFNLISGWPGDRSLDPKYRIAVIRVLIYTDDSLAARELHSILPVLKTIVAEETDAHLRDAALQAIMAMHLMGGAAVEDAHAALESLLPVIKSIIKEGADPYLRDSAIGAVRLVEAGRKNADIAEDSVETSENLAEELHDALVGIVKNRSERDVPLRQSAMSLLGFYWFTEDLRSFAEDIHLDRELREYAITVLNNCSAIVQLAALSQSLKDDRELKEQVSQALQEVSERGKRQSILSEEEFSEMHAKVIALSRAGKFDVLASLAANRSKHPHLRADVLEVIWQRSDSNEGNNVLQELGPVIMSIIKEESDAGLRLSAIHAMGLVKASPAQFETELRDALVAIVKNETDSNVRRGALRLLGKFGAVNDLKSFVEIRHLDSELRSTAVVYLGILGALEQLRDLLKIFFSDELLSDEIGSQIRSIEERNARNTSGESSSPIASVWYDCIKWVNAFLSGYGLKMIYDENTGTTEVTLEITVPDENGRKGFIARRKVNVFSFPVSTFFRNLDAARNAIGDPALDAESAAKNILRNFAIQLQTGEGLASSPMESNPDRQQELHSLVDSLAKSDQFDKLIPLVSSDNQRVGYVALEAIYQRAGHPKEGAKGKEILEGLKPVMKSIIQGTGDPELRATAINAMRFVPMDQYEFEKDLRSPLLAIIANETNPLRLRSCAVSFFEHLGLADDLQAFAANPGLDQELRKRAIFHLRTMDALKQLQDLKQQETIKNDNGLAQAVYTAIIIVNERIGVVSLNTIYTVIDGLRDKYTNRPDVTYFLEALWKKFSRGGSAFNADDIAQKAQSVFQEPFYVGRFTQAEKERIVAELAVAVGLSSAYVLERFRAVSSSPVSGRTTLEEDSKTIAERLMQLSETLPEEAVDFTIKLALALEKLSRITPNDFVEAARQVLGRPHRFVGDDSGVIEYYENQDEGEGFFKKYVPVLAEKVFQDPNFVLEVKRIVVGGEDILRTKEQTSSPATVENQGRGGIDITRVDFKTLDLGKDAPKNPVDRKIYFALKMYKAGWEPISALFLKQAIALVTKNIGTGYARKDVFMNLLQALKESEQLDSASLTFYESARKEMEPAEPLQLAIKS